MVHHLTASYGTSLAIWDHTVLPATRHKWIHPALIPAMQAGTRFTYPGGMEGWVDLVDLIVPRPGVKPATFRSRVQRSTNATTNVRWRCREMTVETGMSSRWLLYYHGPPRHVQATVQYSNYIFTLDYLHRNDSFVAHVTLWRVQSVSTYDKQCN